MSEKVDHLSYVQWIQEAQQDGAARIAQAAANREHGARLRAGEVALRVQAMCEMFGCAWIEALIAVMGDSARATLQETGVVKRGNGKTTATGGGALQTR